MQSEERKGRVPTHTFGASVEEQCAVAEEVAGDIGEVFDLFRHDGGGAVMAEVREERVKI